MSDKGLHDCLRCWEEGGADPFSRIMFLCPTCGNKRCPKATDHRNECTGSNKAGQKGSADEEAAPIIEKLTAIEASRPRVPVLISQLAGESLVQMIARRRRIVAEESRAICDAVGFGTGAMLGEQHIPLKEFRPEPEKIESLAVIARNMNQVRVDMRELGAVFESETTGKIARDGKRYQFFVAFDERHLEGKRFTAVLKLRNADWRTCRLADEIAYRYAQSCQNGRESG